MKRKRQQTGMYDKERSRIREVGSLEELREVTRIVRIRSVPLLGAFGDGINLESELKLLKALLNQTRKLINEGRVHRQI